jgi:hypothetical protein
MSPSTEVRENRDFASEIKFLITPALAEQIRDWARWRLAPDPNGSPDLDDAYRTATLYFDTEQFDVFHRKGSFGRSKYRVRRYGENGAAFLERKLKTGGLLTKRRTLVKLGELERLASAEPERGWAGYWFHQRLLARRLKSVCRISYRRAAHVAMTNSGPIRLTLDHHIRTVPASGFLFHNAEKGARLLENQVVLELKYCVEVPLLFKLLVEEFALNPQPISKYRLAAVALGLVPDSSSGRPPWYGNY